MAKSKQQAEKSTKSIQKELSISFLYFLAFFEGSIVIFLELLGSKLIQAFYGNSLLVWSIVICITISSLTMGYYIGGRLSKKEDNIKILAILFSLAAFFTCVMPVWVISLLEKFSDYELMTATLGTSIFLLAPGVISLGATTPIIIQLLSSKNNESGKSAGNIYAISTFAGIMATIILGFYIMPNMGVKLPLLMAGYILLIIAFFIHNSKVSLGALFLIILCSVSFFKNKEENKLMKTVFTSDGLMGQLKVVDQSFAGYTTKYRLLIINGIPQTIINNEDHSGKSFWEYAHRISATAASKKGGDALLFGMGGGAIANELQKLDFKLDVVDIDHRMFDIAKNYFYFKQKSSTNFDVDDARHFIKTHHKKYDFIMMDICTGEVQPSNVFTIEGIAELKKLLKKDGIIIVQYQEKEQKNAISGSKSIAKTFEKNGFSAFQNVEKGEVSSILIACTLGKNQSIKIDTNNFTPNVKMSKETPLFIKNPYEKIRYNSKNAITLTDDKPLLEKINAFTIESWRKIMIKNYGLKIY